MNNIFSKEERFSHLIEPHNDLSSALSDEMILISGDFYGIQKFIFERLSTKNASKVLRAKSAFIQIFTEYLARYICSELDIPRESIISMNAGKFEILLAKKEIVLESIQKRVDKYFIDNFYGLSGVMLSYVVCKKEDFTDPERYKVLRRKIIDSIEDKKFQKFRLFEEDAYCLLKYDTDITNDTLCKICNIRKKAPKKENCDICDSFVRLGKKLTFGSQNDEIISSEKLGIHFDDNFEIDITLNSKIKSYMLFNDESPADFKILAENSCSKIDTGIKTLAFLKADVDNMGKYIQDNKDGMADSYESFDAFSKTIDNFFSIYIPQMMQKDYPNTYTVFAGGDDLFLVGAWDEILDLARKIRAEFEAFLDIEDLSISFGITLAKPTTPVSYLAEYAEELLEKSKEMDDGKDAITLFDETVKWDSYIKVFDELESAFANKDINTAFTYRLLELCEMRKKVQEDIKATMWRSKLRYSFSRNNDNLGEPFLQVLENVIENYRQETKMFLSEFIYKRRD